TTPDPAVRAAARDCPALSSTASGIPPCLAPPAVYESPHPTPTQRSDLRCTRHPRPGRTHAARTRSARSPSMSRPCRRSRRHGGTSRQAGSHARSRSTDEPFGPCDGQQRIVRNSLLAPVLLVGGHGLISVTGAHASAVGTLSCSFRASFACITSTSAREAAGNDSHASRSASRLVAWLIFWIATFAAPADCRRARTVVALFPSSSSSGVIPVIDDST